MNDAPGVRIVEGVANLPDDAGSLRQRKRAVSLQTVAKRFALDVRHDEKEVTVLVPRVVKWEDVRMLEAGDELYLARETVGSDRCGQVGLEDLHRHLSSVLPVLREINGGHAASSHFADQLVTLTEDGFAPRTDLNHLGEVR